MDGQNDNLDALSKRFGISLPKEDKPKPINLNDLTARQKAAIEKGAEALGIDPVDYATAISYESSGTFDPWVKGPVTKWGQHRGTIQYGEPQRKQYGVYEGQSFEDQVTNSNVRYLKDNGVKPGATFREIYAAINGGSSKANLNTQDANTGRTIADNIANAEKDHRPKVLAKFWGGVAPTPKSEQADNLDALSKRFGLNTQSETTDNVEALNDRFGIQPQPTQPTVQQPTLPQKQQPIVAGNPGTGIPIPQTPKIPFVPGQLRTPPNPNFTEILERAKQLPDKEVSSMFVGPVIQTKSGKTLRFVRKGEKNGEVIFREVGNEKGGEITLLDKGNGKYQLPQITQPRPTEQGKQPITPNGQPGNIKQNPQARNDGFNVEISTQLNQPFSPEMEEDFINWATPRYPKLPNEDEVSQARFDYLQYLKNKQQTFGRSPMVEAKNDQEILDKGSFGKANIDVKDKPKGENTGRYLQRMALQALVPDATPEQVAQVVDENYQKTGKYTVNHDGITDEYIAKAIKAGQSSVVPMSISNRTVNNLLSLKNGTVNNLIDTPQSNIPFVNGVLKNNAQQQGQNFIQPELRTKQQMEQSQYEVGNRDLKGIEESYAEKQTRQEIENSIKNPEISWESVGNSAGKGLSDGLRTLYGPLAWYEVVRDKYNEMAEAYKNLGGIPESRLKELTDLQMSQIRKDFPSFSDYQKTKEYIAKMDVGEFAMRIGANYIRSTVNTAISSSLKGIDVIDAYLEKVNPLSFIASEKYIPSLRNFENLLGYTISSILGKGDQFQRATMDSPANQRLLYTIGKQIEDTFGEDKYLRNGFFKVASENLGSITGFMLLGFAAPELALETRFGEFSLTSAGAGALGEAASMYDQAKGKGMSENMSLLAAFIGTLTGASEGFGAGAALNKALKAEERRGLIKHIVAFGKKFKDEFIEEGTQETGQNVGEDLFWKFLEKEDAPLYQKVINVINDLPDNVGNNIVKNGIPAGFFGGIFGGASNIVGGMLNREPNAANQNSDSVPAVDNLTPEVQPTQKIQNLKPSVPKIGKNETPGETVSTQETSPIEQPTIETKPAETENTELEQKQEFEHTDFGRVTEADNQSGVPKDKIRVEDKEGKFHVIQKPKKTGAGNQKAIPVRVQGLRFDDGNQNEGENQTQTDLPSNKETQENQQVTQKPEEKTGLQSNKKGEIGQIFDGFTGENMTRGLRNKLWSWAVEGKTTENGTPSNVLQIAKVIREKGGLQTQEEFDRFLNDYYDNLGDKKGEEIRPLANNLYAKYSAKVEAEQEKVEKPSVPQIKNGKEKSASVTKDSSSSGSVIDLKSSINSFAEGMPIDQTPSAERRIDGLSSSNMKNAERSDLPLPTESAAISSSSISSKDKPSVPEISKKKLEEKTEIKPRFSKTDYKDEILDSERPEPFNEVIIPKGELASSYVKRLEKGEVEPTYYREKEYQEDLAFKTKQENLKKDVKTETDIDELSKSQQVSPNIEQPSIKETKESVKDEKINPRTGLTKTQSEFLAKELQQIAYDKLEEQGLNLKDFKDGFPSLSMAVRFENPEFIKVPGDGQFKVDNVDAANRLHHKITGKPIPEFEKTKNTSIIGTTREVPKSSKAVDVNPIELYGTPENAYRILTEQKSLLENTPENEKQLKAVDSMLKNLLDEMGKTISFKGEPLTTIGKEAKNKADKEKDNRLKLADMRAEKEFQSLDDEGKFAPNLKLALQTANSSSKSKDKFYSPLEQAKNTKKSILSQLKREFAAEPEFRQQIRKELDADIKSVQDNLARSVGNQGVFIRLKLTENATLEEVKTAIKNKISDLQKRKETAPENAVKLSDRNNKFDIQKDISKLEEIQELINQILDKEKTSQNSSDGLSSKFASHDQTNNDSETNVNSDKEIVKSSEKKEETETGIKLKAIEDTENNSFTYDGFTVDSTPIPFETTALQNIQNRTIQEVKENPQKFIDEYISRFGSKNINADLAKEIFDEYNNDPLATSQSVHRASAMVSNLVFQKQLRELPPKSVVIFTAGGAASGKTYSIGNINADLLYDGVMRNQADNRKTIQRVLDAGHYLTIFFISRPIQEAAKSNIQRSLEEGRVVPLKNFAEGHYQSQQAFINDTNDFAQNNNVKVYYLQNGVEGVKELSFEEFKKQAYDNYEGVLENAKNASYQELRNYDERTRNAFEGAELSPRNQSTIRPNQTTNDRESESSQPQEQKPLDGISLKSVFDNATGPEFYSTVERVIENAKQEKFSVDQVKALFKTPGIKQEELEWLDIDSFLDGKDKISKSDLLDYIRANSVEIQEVLKSDDVLFSQYTLPGGENYKELLLTLPLQKTSVNFRVVSDYQGKINKTDKPFNSREEAQQWIDEMQDAFYPETKWSIEEDSSLVKDGSKNYTSRHWSEENVVAHIRFDERTDSEGRKTLHIAEIQSDWHQEGRKKGYKSALYKIESEIRAMQQEFGGHDELTFGDAPNEAKKQYDTLQSDYSKISDAVPNAPFKKSWQELAFKKALRYAVENGFDAISWDTGATNADRYDLSKQISSLQYKKNENGNVDLHPFDLKGVEISDDSFKNLSESDLEETIGKDIAQKIINEEGESKKGGYRQLSGVDLKVGGEGMVGFYDKILPAFVKKYVKKWGSTLEQGKISPKNHQKVFIKQTPRNFEIWGTNTKTHNVEWIESHRTIELAENRAKDFEGIPAHSVEITPAMKESVLFGQPLFAISEDQKKAEFQAVKTHSNSDLTQNGEFVRFGDHISINVQTQEVLRRLAEELDIRNNVKKRGDIDTETGFSGIFYDEKITEKSIELLKEIAVEAKTNGFNQSAEFLSRLADTFIEAAKVGEGTVVITVFDKRLSHERLHQRSYLGSSYRGLARRYADLQDLGRAKSKVGEIFRKAFASFVALEKRNWQIEFASDYELGHAAEEIFTYISDGEFGVLNLDIDESSELAVELALRYAVARQDEARQSNQKVPTRYEALKTFQGTVAEKWLENIKEFENEKETEKQQSQIDVSNSVGRESGRNDSESERTSSRNEKRQDGNEKRDNKVAAFSRILGKEITYKTQSHQQTERKAEEIEDSKGVAQAVSEALTSNRPTAETMRVVYRELERLNNLADEHLANGNQAEYNAVADELAKLTTQIVNRQIELGQAVEIAKTLQPLSPEHTLLVASRLKQAATKNDSAELTPSEIQKIRELAIENQATTKALTKAESVIEKLKKKIKELRQGTRVLKPRQSVSRPLTQVEKNIQSELAKDFDKTVKDLQSTFAANETVNSIENAALKAVEPEELTKTQKQQLTNVGAKLIFDGLKTRDDYNLESFEKDLVGLVGNKISPHLKEIHALAMTRLKALKQSEKIKRLTQRLREESPDLSQAEAESKAVEKISQQIAKNKEKAKIIGEHTSAVKAFYKNQILTENIIAHNDNAEVVYAAILLETEKGLSINSTVRTIANEFDLSPEEARIYATTAKQILLKIKFETEDQKREAENISVEEQKKADELRIKQAQARLKLSRFLMAIQNNQNLLQRFNNDFRAKLVLNHGTQIFNVLQSVAGTIPQEIFIDLIDSAIRKARRMTGRKNALDEISPETSFKDAFLPLAYIFGNRRQLAENVLSHFPEEYFRVFNGLLGDVEIDAEKIERGNNRVSKFLHKSFDKSDQLNNWLAKITFASWQEAHFRTATVIASLNQQLRAKGLELKDLLNEGRLNEIPEEVVKSAVDKALRITFAEDMKDSDGGRLLKQSYEWFDSWLPVFLNPVVFARFSYTVSKAVINAHTFGALDVFTKEGYTTRSAAKGFYGVTAIAIAYALAALCGSDDDKWYHWKLTKDSSPVDIRRWFPLAAYAFTAHVIKSKIEGRPRPSANDFIEGFASLNIDQYFRGVGLEFAQSLIDSVWSSDPEATEKLEKLSGKLLGSTLSAYLRFFKPFRDIFAEINEEERKYRDFSDTAKDNFIEEIARNLPLGNVLDSYGYASKKNPVTGKDIEQIHPLGKLIGLNFVNPIFTSPKLTVAEQVAKELFPFEFSGGKMTKDELDAYRIRKEIKEAVRRGELSEKDAESKIDSFVKNGEISEKSADLLKKSIKMTDLQETIKRNVSLADEKDLKNLSIVWNRMTEKEREEVRDVLSKKQNISNDVIQKYGLGEKGLVIMPENIQKEFRKLNIVTFEPREIEIEKEESKNNYVKIALSDSQLQEFKSRVLKETYSKLEKEFASKNYTSEEDNKERKKIIRDIKKEAEETILDEMNKNSQDKKAFFIIKKEKEDEPKK